MSRVKAREGLLILAIAVVAVAMIWPIYSRYREAESAAWEAVTLRVMQSLESFQAEALARRGTYQTGFYDAANGVTTLRDTLGWAPSRWDRTRYEVREAEYQSYEVVAQRGRRTMCRRFPGGVPCQ